MAGAIGIRGDYTGAALRRFARRCGDADQVRRLLSLAVILDGGRRSDAARVGGVTLQIVRDWVLRFKDIAAFKKTSLPAWRKSGKVFPQAQQ